MPEESTRDVCTVHAAFDTDIPADCAEFNPWDPRVVAVGKYLLKDAATQTKEGAVDLYCVSADHSRVTLAGSFTTGAVFDCKWLTRDTLVLARSDGLLETRRVDVDPDGCCLREEGAARHIPTECGPVTYVAPRGLRLATAHGGGKCAVWDLGEGGDDATAVAALKTAELAGHEYDAWVAAWHDENTVWTGGDDARLALWDLRMSAETPVWAKRQDMGVTSIAPHPTRPVVAVGSYDESLVLWDVRAVGSGGRPLRKAAADAADTEGGGVWRLKWHKEHQDVLLAACMHAGFRVFRLEDEAQFVCRAEYHGPHNNLAYGADWQPMTATDSDGRKVLVAATASFYDKKFSVWSVPLDCVLDH